MGKQLFLMPRFSGNRRRFIAASLFTLLLLFNGGCAIQMTFDGASIPEDIHTASVQNFENRASYVNPVLSQNFTEALKDRIIDGSRLRLADGTGDVDFSGAITRYETEPLAIQSDAVSSETRLNVTINVRYENTKNPDESWESSFSAHRDFPSEQNITAIEGELMDEIIEELTENIFNKAFADW
ncbi:MAG: LPS assembly lipoprotein LptE [Bacteroidota bacterium]